MRRLVSAVVFPARTWRYTRKAPLSPLQALRAGAAASIDLPPPRDPVDVFVARRTGELRRAPLSEMHGDATVDPGARTLYRDSQLKNGNSRFFF
jgi:hypothetical protein